MNLDTHPESDQHQNQTSSRGSPPATTHQIWWWSMNPFMRYLADKNSAHTHTHTQTRRWPQDLSAYGAQVTYKTCKAPVRSSSPTNQHPVFLLAGCPSYHPTNSVKTLKWKISHSMDLLIPSSPGVFQLCLWPLIAPGYLGGGLPCLSSALGCQYPNSIPKLIGT